MRKLKGLFIVLLVLTGGLAHGQEKNKDVMLNRIFAVLKNSDEEGFVQLFPDAALTRTFLLSMIQKDTSVEASEQLVEALMEKITDEELQKDYRMEFKKIMQKAHAERIDLSKAVLVSYTADSAMKEEDDLKVPVLSGKIYFNADGQEYFIRYDNVIWFDAKGWYGVSIKRIDKKSRENEPEPDDNEYATMDTTMVTPVDTVKAIQPQPVKKVNTKKPPVKPVKGKTTTAARKPD